MVATQSIINQLSLNNESRWIYFSTRTFKCVLGSNAKYYFRINDSVGFSHRYSIVTLTDWEAKALARILSKLYCPHAASVHVNSCYKKYATIQ